MDKLAVQCDIRCAELATGPAWQELVALRPSSLPSNSSRPEARMSPPHGPGSGKESWRGPWMGSDWSVARSTTSYWSSTEIMIENDDGDDEEEERWRQDHPKV